MTQESQPGPTRGQSQGRLPAFSRRRARRGGESGFGHSGDQMGRGGHLGGAGDEPKLLVESVALGAAGIGADGERGGGRSSGEVGFGVRGHGREASGGYGLLETCWVRWCARLRAATAPATVVTRHGGGELSGPAEAKARAAQRHGKKRGMDQWLTASPTSARARPGTLCGRRIKRRRSSVQRKKMASVTALQGVRRLVAPW